MKFLNMETHNASSSHEVSLEPTFQRREDSCEICQEDKNYKGPVQKTQWRKPYLVLKILVTWLQQITKFSVKVVNLETNHRYAGRGAGFSHSNGSKRIRAKQNFRRNPEKLAKVPGTREETKSHLHWPIPRNSAKPVKIFPGIIARLHHTDRRLMVLLKEQCAE